MTGRETKAWQDLDGVDLDGFRVACGLYGNGRGAAEVVDSSGVPECRITVNLVEHTLAEGEFHVRFEDRKYSPDVFQRLIDRGLAAPTGRVVPAGYVERYAEVWQLALPEAVGE